MYAHNCLVIMYRGICARCGKVAYVSFTPLLHMKRTAACTPTSFPPQILLISSLSTTGLLNGLFGLGGAFSPSTALDFRFLAGLDFFVAPLVFWLSVSASRSASSSENTSSFFRLRFPVPLVVLADEFFVVVDGDEDDDAPGSCFGSEVCEPGTPPMPGSAILGVADG